AGIRDELVGLVGSEMCIRDRYLSFLEIMDKWPEKNNDRGYTVRIEGEDPSEIYLDYYENNKNMYGNCSYGKKRWDLILFVYQELLEAKEVSYLEA
ncbi:hypothetical protein ACN6QF_19820, partial [Acinetobacter baumannii]